MMHHYQTRAIAIGLLLTLSPLEAFSSTSNIEKALKRIDKTDTLIIYKNTMISRVVTANCYGATVRPSQMKIRLKEVEDLLSEKMESNHRKLLEDCRKDLKREMKMEGL